MLVISCSQSNASSQASKPCLLCSHSLHSKIHEFLLATIPDHSFPSSSSFIVCYTCRCIDFSWNFNFFKWFYWVFIYCSDIKTLKNIRYFEKQTQSRDFLPKFSFFCIIRVYFYSSKFIITESLRFPFQWYCACIYYTFYIILDPLLPPIINWDLIVRFFLFF